VCRSTVDIHSATAKIRRRKKKKKKKKKKPQGKNITASATQGGHNYLRHETISRTVELPVQESLIIYAKLSDVNPHYLT